MDKNTLNNKKPELLSPAGSYEGFIAALCAGADAVYCGGNAFGARAYAKNFSDEELLKAIDVAHLYGKKLYLTVNTLCKERELSSLRDFITPFYERGLDGVIVQDIGLINIFIKEYPDMEVHASTQMTITGINGASFLKELGATRVVPARELSLKEIKEIYDNTALEIECFIHGAMCYSYSGLCFMSSFLGGRSGNRGRCAQPCRLPYETELTKKGEEYPLSMKDLCAINYIPDMIDAGVSSFKIEGRMKKPEYTYFVTKMYRKYIDLYLDKGKAGYKVSEQDYKALTDFYKRCEPECGYLYRHNGRELITLNKPSYNSEVDSGEVSYNLPKLPLNAVVNLYIDKPAEIIVYDNEFTASATGCEVSRALNRPLLKDDILKSLNKTGDTDFEFENIDINSDEDIFMPVKELNSLRRAGIDAYYKNRLLSYFRTYNNKATSKEKNISSNNNISYTALCENTQQIKAINDCKNMNFSRIYIETSVFSENNVDIITSINSEIYIALPYVLRNKDIKLISKILNNNKFIKGALVRNYEELYFIKNNYKHLKITSDFTLYSYNQSACELLLEKGVNDFTLPIELNIHELCERDYLNKSEIIYYGKIPFMISAGCVINTLNGCKKNKSGNNLILKDRKNQELLVKTDCNFCYNRIINSIPISLHKEKDKLSNNSINSLRFQFCNETYEETLNILNGIYDNIEYTKGHFKKSVE